MNNVQLKRLAKDLVNRGYGNYGFTTIYDQHSTPAHTVWCDSTREIGAYDNGSLILRGFTTVEEHILKTYIKIVRGY